MSPTHERPPFAQRELYGSTRRMAMLTIGFAPCGSSNPIAAVLGLLGAVELLRALMPVAPSAPSAPGGAGLRIDATRIAKAWMLLCVAAACLVVTSCALALFLVFWPSTDGSNGMALLFALSLIGQIFYLCAVVMLAQLSHTSRRAAVACVIEAQAPAQTQVVGRLVEAPIHTADGSEACVVAYVLREHSMHINMQTLPATRV